MFEPFRDSKGISHAVIVIVLIAIVGAALPMGVALYYGIVERQLHFVVSDDGLTVRFGVGSIQFDPADVASVEYVPEPPRMARAAGAGTGGLQMGWYRMEGFGRVYRLTTARKDLVFIDTSQSATKARPATRYVFNPEQPERFVELLQRMQQGEIVSAQDGSGEVASVFAPAVSGSSGFVWGILLFALVFIPVGIVLPWLLLAGPRSLRYEIGPEGITVHHLGRKLYPWDRITDVRVVDEMPRVWRVFGTSLPGYYAGSFRGGSLGTFQLNATRNTAPVVLVETDKQKLIVSPDDIDRFMETVAQFHPVNGKN